MTDFKKIDNSIPVAPLALVVHESAASLGRDVDRLISSKRKIGREQFVPDLEQVKERQFLMNLFEEKMFLSLLIYVIIH